jgi:hypothetical protein
MTNEQMELGFNGTKIEARAGRRESRIERAAWWFARMRETVNNAMDWQPVPQPRPEQEWLGFSHHRQSA